MSRRHITFFAQDEGSAKALTPVIREWAMRDDLILLVRARGPAIQVFNRMGIPFTISEPGDNADGISPRPDLIVTGASMRVSIEKEAIRFARRQGIASVTLLDSPLWPWWRFTVDGSRDFSALPDHILVLDPGCKERMVAEGFPAGRLTPTGNPHFDTLLNRKRANEPARPGGILLVTQPKYENGVYKSDFDWLQSALCQCQRQAPEMQIVIRPHKKEDMRIFSPFISKNVRMDTESDILDLMVSRRLIIGKNSSALLEALILGILVITYSNTRAELLEVPIGDRVALIRALDCNELAGALRISLKKTKPHRAPNNIPFYTDGLNRQRVVDFLDNLIREQME